MPGLKLTLPLDFTDNTLPKLLDDPVLPTTGALLLIDPSHSLGAWPAGVPGLAATLPNVAATQARALLGSGLTAAQLSATVATAASGMSASQGKAERTTKGGLHVIVSPTNYGAMTTGLGMKITMPDAVRDYLVANPTHDVYASLWQNNTRIRVAGFATHSIFSTNSTPLTNNSFVLCEAISRAAGANANNIGARPDKTPANGTDFRSQGSSGWAGPTAVPANVFAIVAAWGKAGTESTIISDGSWVFYRFYFEDLTISGRSYATVDALDYAEYTKQVLTVGGRYYGDTLPTAPTTIP